MTNWCQCELTIEGPKPLTEKFLRFAAGESPFDFNRVIRYPEKFQQLDDAVEAWDKENAKRPDADWRARPKDGYNAGGADWCLANWGTTSLACHVEVEGPITAYDDKVQVVLFFDTAWSPPTPVIRKASELYPALCFELRYYEGDCGVPGLFSCTKGAVSDESEPYLSEAETNELRPGLGKSKADASRPTQRK